jgi:hypothetical protein
MQFTSQDDYFPIWPRKGESYDDTAVRVRAQKFAIQDDLLYASLMWTTDLGDGRRMNGVWQSKHSTGYACVFRANVTDRFGMVTGDFGNVTGHFGNVTERTGRQDWRCA